MILRADHVPADRAPTPFPLILLDTCENPVEAPAGITYRTKPEVWIARNGRRYVVKRDTVTTVVAEALGYGLAELVHLPVPPFALSRIKETPGFAFCSEYQARNDVLRYLERGQLVNPEIVGDTLVFDLWVANDDRNVMAFVGHIPETAALGQLEALAIDFECSQLLRGVSPISVNMLKLAPRPEVKRYLQLGADPFTVMCRRIKALTDSQIAGVFNRLRFQGEAPLFPALYPVWADSAIRALINRASRIDALVNEVLRGR